MEGWATAGATPGFPGPPCDPGTDAGGRTECAADGDHSEWIEFCHRVAATVFKTLVDADHRTVETAVMDVYFDLAETMPGMDGLCLRPLESMTTALHAHLASVGQADVLERATSNLASWPDVTKTLAATLAEMERFDLVESCTCSAQWSGPDATTRVVELTFEDYAFSAREGRLPALPVVLELYQRTSSWGPVSLHVTSAGSGWHVVLSMFSTLSAIGLTSVPIRKHAID